MSTPNINRWNGRPGALIHGHTNPWLRDPDGSDADLAARFGPTPTAADSPCGACGPLAGILAPMDTGHGIQRCDVCDLYPGDLEAAAALAAHLGSGHTVWFYGTLEPPSPAAVRVLHALDDTPRPLDEIAARAGVSLMEAQSELGLLATDGRVTSSLAGWRTR